MLKHAAVKELFADGASVQAMVDSGIKLSDLQVSGQPHQKPQSLENENHTTLAVLFVRMLQNLLGDFEGVSYTLVGTDMSLPWYQGLELMEEENVDDDDDKAALDW